MIRDGQLGGVPVQPIYAVQFEVRPPNGLGADAVPALVEVAVRDWVVDWYRARKSHELRLPADGGRVTPTPQDSIDITSETALRGERFWKLVWTHPDDRDDNLFWQSQCLVAHAMARTEISLILRLTSREFEIKPAGFRVVPPKVVRGLIEKFPCYLGGRRLRTSPLTLRAEDIHAFVKDTLQLPERRLPVVLISLERETDLPLAHPGRLADRLAGLAEVYVLSDRWAAYSLTDEVGKANACYDGAVRIYWPSFYTARDPGYHFVYLGERLRKLQKSQQGVEDIIFGWLRAVSVMRVVEGPVTSSAIEATRAELRHRRAAELESLKEALVAGEASQERIRAELERVQQERDAALDRIAELEDELESQKRQWVEWQQYMNREQEEAQLPSEAEEPEFPTVLQALKRASVDLGRRLEVLDSAWTSAEESRYKEPEKAYRALEAIRELAGLWFDKKKRVSVGPWEDFFRKRTFTIAMHESQTTMGRYAKERTFAHGGKKITMEKHITLGGGSRENCLQIYFEVDEPNGKFLIGYCGMHLPYAGWRT